MLLRESTKDDILRFAKNLSDKDDPVYPTYFIHFTNVLKISLNPSYFYNLAPLGVYAFPVFSYQLLFLKITISRSLPTENISSF